MSAGERITLVLLGAGGDLTERLLLPALGEVLTRNPDLDLLVIGAARSERDDWGDYVRDALAQAGIDLASPAVAAMLTNTRYQSADATDSQALSHLLTRTDGRVILYFALAQTITESVLDALAEVDLPADLRVALEKPVGTDEESVTRVNAKAEQLVGADNVVRVDHFLGMAATRNLLALRMGNPAVDAALDHADRVEIVFNESLALEGRAEFYESTGAIRDMMQSHLLQVLAVLMIDTDQWPSGVPFADRVAQVLRYTHLNDPVTTAVTAGRYGAGQLNGRAVPGYLEEDGVDPDGRVETYARLSLRVSIPRWEELDVHLESGKAVGNPRQEIVVHFPHTDDAEPDLQTADRGNSDSVLRLGFEDGSVIWELNGEPHEGTPGITLHSQQPAQLSAYGWIMHWLLTDDFTFTVAAAAAEEGWRIVQPALDAIAAGTVPLLEYPAGTAHPLR